MPRKSTGKTKKSKKKASSKEQPGLRVLVQQRILNDVLQASADNWGEWMVLIVDKYSMRILSTAVGMYDIMERRVTLVEDITKKRAPFKDMAAVYLLAPTDDSVNRLIADFEKPLYADAAFIYFLGRVPEKQLEKIKQCRPLLKRMRAFSEANIDFLAKELRAFAFDMKKSFSDIYVRKSRTKIEAKMAEKLVSVCSVLNELPHIRYTHDSPTATTLAKTFHVKMEQFVRNNTTFWYHGDASNNERERATLLILDRKDDCLTPLMHDFTYQAMVNDLLPIDDDKITIVSETEAAAAEQDTGAYDDEYDEDEDEGEGIEVEEKEPEKPKSAKDILLNESDSIWVELRGKHIAEVINILSDRCREMVNSDTSGLASAEKGKTMSLSQMASALKALPEYREVMAKLSQHMQLAHQCMDKFSNGGLLELSELEQTLATGQTEDGDKPSVSDMVEKVKQQLGELKGSSAKLRLLLILIISQHGVKPAEKDELWSAANIGSDEQKIIDNIRDHLEVATFNTEEKKGFSSMFADKIQASGAIDTDTEYSSSRYVAPLKLILEEMISNQLSFELYPSVSPMPEMHGTGSGAAHSARKRPEGSARKGGATSRWQRSAPKEKAKEETYQGGRVIVFIIGGMCFSELRIARDVMIKENKEIVAGSTAFLKPKQFMDYIRRL